MEILLQTNPLRIVSATFMFLHPVVNKAEFNNREKYMVVHATYGKLGYAELITSFPRALFDIPPVSQLLADGDKHAVDRFKAIGCSHAQEMQVCTFRMKDRYSAMSEMIIKECAKIGIPFIQQPKLF